MPITFKCSLCGLLAEAPDYALGKEEPCTICGTVNVVEHAQTAAPVPLDLAFSLSDVPLDYRPKSSVAGAAILGAPIQADAKAPGIVRAYALIYSVLGILGAILGVAGFGYYFYLHSDDYESATLIALILPILFCAGMVFMAKGLKNRRRVALYFLCLLAVLGAIGGLTQANYKITQSGPQADALIRLTILGLFYIPPIISAFNHWELFR
jgi:hypothetical protein